MPKEKFMIRNCKCCVSDRISAVYGRIVFSCVITFFGWNVAFAEVVNTVASLDPVHEAILDTIAQINHINWVVNTIKTYNNIIVLEEEYEKISPGNLNLSRIPDKQTLERINRMLDTLHSLRKDDRQMRKWREDFKESRERKLKTYKLKATKDAVDTITSQVSGCLGSISNADMGGSIAAAAQTVFNVAYYSVSLYNDYDNFVYELDKTARDRQFDFDTAKLDILHQQNKELLQDQWSFINRYKLDDRLRVSDTDIKILLNCLKDEKHSRIYTRLVPMRERFSLFPEYWYYLSCVAMETGHFKEGIEACDKFFKVNRGIFRDDPMVGTVAFNKAFMLPKTEENKSEVRRCLELAYKNNVLRGDWQLEYLVAIMYKGVFNEQIKADMMLEHALALIESAIKERRQYGIRVSSTLEIGRRNCRNVLHHLRGEPLEDENEMEASLIETQNIIIGENISFMSATNTCLSLMIPNDKNIHDWSKYALQLLSRGKVVANVYANVSNCGIDTNGYITLSFNAPFIPSLNKIDEYCLAYNNPKCPLKWTFRSTWYYFSDAEMDDFHKEVLNIIRSRNMLLRVLVWLKSDKERTKLKESFIESLCLTAYHYSVSINGDELFYVHSISSLYNNRNKLERATSKEYEIYAKHMKQFLIDLDGKQYVELDEILPCFKEAFKNVWRDFARCLD